MLQGETFQLKKMRDLSMDVYKWFRVVPGSAEKRFPTLATSYFRVIVTFRHILDICS
jgi:hypothetical protein